MGMRKLLLLVTLAATFGVVAQAAPASAFEFRAPDGVVGTGTLGQFGVPTVYVHAVQTVPGLHGGFIITYPDGTFADEVATCLFVSGDTAYVTGKILRSGGPRQQPNNWARGNFIVLGVVGNQQSAPDLMNFSPGFAADPGCGPIEAAVPVFPIEAGFFRVFGHS
jgi:hypothetical protein